MSIKRYKDRTNLVGTFRLNSSRKPHYVRVYVWKDRASLVANTTGTDMETAACHCPHIWWEDTDTGEKEVPPLLGEVHFDISHWHDELVAHELMHALINRMRLLPPDHKDYLVENEIEVEEEICYEFGRWYNRTAAKLWSMYDPHIVQAVRDMEKEKREHNGEQEQGGKKESAA